MYRNRANEKKDYNRDYSRTLDVCKMYDSLVAPTPPIIFWCTHD